MADELSPGSSAQLERTIEEVTAVLQCRHSHVNTEQHDATWVAELKTFLSIPPDIAPETLEIESEVHPLGSIPSQTAAESMVPSTVPMEPEQTQRN